MAQSLIDAATTGDVDRFYQLLGQDRDILEPFDLAPFVDTPLHIAVVAEKTAFAVEIANLKPSFARKLNQAGVSPIHLASTNGSLKIVLELLSKDHDLCLLVGREKNIPLHFAATAGKVDVMEALLKECPHSIGMLTVSGETPLHLAAKNNQVEACKVLLKWINKLNRMKLMKWKDENGQTALDVAQSFQVRQVLENEINTSGCVRVIDKFLKWGFTDEVVSNDTRNAMLVVLGLIITTTFQAAISPPGGVWQDTIYSNNNANATTASAGTQPAHNAGKAVMGQHDYVYFVVLNTFGFCASIIAIYQISKEIPIMLHVLLMLCIGPMVAVYMVSVLVINPKEVSPVRIIISAFYTVTILYIIVTVILRLHHVKKKQALR